MRKLISVVLLLLAFLLFIGGGFEISGMMGWPSLGWGIALSLGGQVTLFLAGEISRPARGKMGVFRAVAFTLFVVWSLAVVVVPLEILYCKMGEDWPLKSSELVWTAVQALSAMALLLTSVKRWKLMARYRENNRMQLGTARRS